MAGFTTIAAAAGLAATAGSTAMSFKQAADARRAQQAAEEKAAERLADARKKFDVNVFDAMALPKEPYTLAFEQSQVAANFALDAARQGSPRGIGATSGGLLIALQEQNKQTRADMSKELYNIQATQLEEDSRLRDMQAQLDLEEAMGASEAARDNDIMANQAQAQALEGITNMGGQLASFAPLYEKTKGSRALQGTMKKNSDIQSQIAGQGNLFGVDVSGLGDLSPMQFENFMLNNFSPEQIRGLRKMNFGANTLSNNNSPSFSDGIEVQGINPNPFYDTYYDTNI